MSINHTHDCHQCKGFFDCSDDDCDENTLCLECELENSKEEVKSLRSLLAWTRRTVDWLLYDNCEDEQAALETYYQLALNDPVSLNIDHDAIIAAIKKEYGCKSEVSGLKTRVAVPTKITGISPSEADVTITENDKECGCDHSQTEKEHG